MREHAVHVADVVDFARRITDLGQLPNQRFRRQFGCACLDETAKILKGTDEIDALA